MNKLKGNFLYFLKNKLYMSVVCLTAVFSYGFAMTHPSIGIDDTCIELYFEEGLAPAVGRWVLYLLNKVISLDAFLPWMTEVVAVAIFVLSVTLWCVLLRRLVKREISIWGYAIFAALFLSCPLISEVFVFYLHNGICIAYGLTALAIMAVLDAMEEKKVLPLLTASGLLTVALGCYESFMIVYFIGLIIAFILIRIERNKEEPKTREKIRYWVGYTLGTVICAVVLRALIIRVLQLIFGFAIPEDFTVTARGVVETLTGNGMDLAMVLKRFWVMYYLNGFCYLPITVLVSGIVILIGYGIFKAVQKKDAFLAVAMVKIPIAPLAIVLIEGLPTHYRASQYVPLVGAFVAFVLFYEIAGVGKEKARKISTYAAVSLSLILLWNQAVDMNKWFYIDYLKYEDTKQVMQQIAYDLKKEHDVSKPIIFMGAYMVPYEIAKDAYLPFYSPTYQTPVASTLRWGVTAFDGTPRELQAFWEMHGYDFRIETDWETIDGAYDVLDQIPPYPQKGYIYETEENIIIHVSNQ